MDDNFKIVPVASDDIPVLGEMLYHRKLDLTINRLLWRNWPNEAAQKPQYTSSIEAAFNAADMEDFKVIDSQTQKIIGYVVLKKEQPSSKPSTEAQEILDDFNPDVYKMVMQSCDEITKQFSDFEHYDIVYIMVDPLYRRRGIGTELVKVCFDKASAAGLPVCICVEPAAYDFHRKLGFEDVKHVDMELDKFAPAYTGFGTFRLSGMVWRPEQHAK